MIGDLVTDAVRVNLHRLRLLRCAALASLLICGGTAAAQPAPASPAVVKVTPAVDGVFDAFASHPIVALSDDHGLAQELDFYAAIVRDPRFAAQVGNLVVELGSATHQATLDRYLSGHAVPYAELRKIWTDTVSGPALYIGYMNLLAQVRETNRTLPADKRIRVLLGEPAIDWPKITTPAEHLPYQADRQSHAARLIKSEILAKGQRALVIYGGGHLYRERVRYPFTKGAAVDPRAPAALKTFFQDLAQRHPDYGSFTPAWADQLRPLAFSLGQTVQTYGDVRSILFLGRTGDEDVFVIEFDNAKLKVHARLDREGKIDLVGWEPTPYRDGGGTITDRVEATFPGSVFVVAAYTGYPQKACSERFERAHGAWLASVLVQPVRGTLVERDLTADGCRMDMASIADGLLYLGPAATLTMGPEIPDIYMDDGYRREEDRRWQIQGDAPLDPVDVRDYPSSPAKVWPD